MGFCINVCVCVRLPHDGDGDGDGDLCPELAAELTVSRNRRCVTVHREQDATLLETSDGAIPETAPLSVSCNGRSLCNCREKVDASSESRLLRSCVLPAL